MMNTTAINEKLYNQHIDCSKNTDNYNIIND